MQCIFRYDIGTTAANHTQDFTKATGAAEGHLRTLRASRCLTKVAADVLIDDNMYNKVLEVFQKGK